MFDALFEAGKLGKLELPHRLVMAPMTRARAQQPGDLPTPLMAHYYAQRAEAAFIVSEATQISPQGKGYSFTPGIHSLAQEQGWAEVTRAVHAAGGRIVLQLWHVGRMSHPSFHADGLPVAPSAIAPGAQVWVAGDDGVGRLVDCPTPRALGTAEIAGVVDDYRRAAERAMHAGFDGVELHGANGYLIDQFLRSSANHRTDVYGGSRTNRLRLLYEVVDAVAAVWGADRVGLRLSPHITQRGMACPDIVPTVLDAARELGARGLGYMHFAEADWDDAPAVPQDFRVAMRQRFGGAIVVAGGYDAAHADALLRGGLVDLVAMGRPFIANPDLPQRLRHGTALAAFDSASLFGGDARGYTDYPRAAQGRQR